MTNSYALEQLFPQDNELPAEHRPPSPIHQRTYLVNGELKTWDGPVDAVRSPVCVL
jgi:aldehyde dehydrogenase (NAD+)